MEEMLVFAVASIVILLSVVIGVLIVDKTRSLCNRLFPRLELWYRKHLPKRFGRWVYGSAVVVAIVGVAACLVMLVVWIAEVITGEPQ